VRRAVENLLYVFQPSLLKWRLESGVFPFAEAMPRSAYPEETTSEGVERVGAAAGTAGAVTDLERVRGRFESGGAMVNDRGGWRQLKEAAPF
jgi:hypothetical protein